MDYEVKKIKTQAEIYALHQIDDQSYNSRCILKLSSQYALYFSIQYTVATWLHLLKRRRNQPTKRKGTMCGFLWCLASVCCLLAVCPVCALPIYKKPPRRRQAAGHREIVAQKGRNKEAQEFPSFARKPQEVLLVDRGFLWV